MSRQHLPHRGMTMIELLMGLAIAAVLFVAIAGVVQASTTSYRTNGDFLQASQTARTALRGISDAVRRSDACDVGGGARAGAATPAANVLYLVPVDTSGSNGTAQAYVYDASAKELLLDQNPPAPPIDATAMAAIRSRIGASVFRVADHVTGMSFKGSYAVVRDVVGGTEENRLVNVQMTMTVQAGDQTRTLCESVVPRRAYRQR